MALTGWTESVVTALRGMWSSLAQRAQGNPSRASFMQNMRFSPGRVFSRPGTTSVGVNSVGKVTSMYNWVSPSGVNWIIFQDGANVYALNQATGVKTLLYGTTARATAVAEIDIWVYMAGFDVNGNGVGQLKIFDGTNVDTGFRGPVTPTAVSPTDGGIGQCNVGTHYLGFTYQNRTGFEGPPQTSFGGSQISVTLNSDLRQINFSVTLPALSDAGGVSQCFLLMTRADNPSEWYYIPTDVQSGSIGELPVPVGGAVTLNFVANFSDADIAASLNPATNQFLLLTQDGAGNGPITPSSLRAYGTRMVYFDGTAAYFSTANNPQQITADQNQVSMPNKRAIGTGFSLQGSTAFYITGDRWTASVTDTADIPATWAEPYGVSDALGVSLHSLVSVRTQAMWAWVVTESGPYRFNGAYDDRPLTYLSADLWARVNWAANYAISIADDVANLRLYIAVPMDGATEANSLFTIDYQGGTDYSKVDISLDVFSFAGGPSLGAIAVVKEIATALSNLWIGPDSANPISHFDDTTTNDLGNMTDQVWESGQLRKPGQISTQTIRVGPFDIWMRGAGLPVITLYGPDKVRSAVSPLLLNASTLATSLSMTPGQHYILKVQMNQIENYTIRFEMNQPNGYMEINNFIAYMMKDLSNR